MKKFILLFSVVVLLGVSGLVYAKPMNPQQQQFVDFMIPKIEKANAKIIQQRKKLINLYRDYQNQNSLSSNNISWLKSLAKQYGLKKASFQKNSTWQQMLARVDIVPAPLVLAQSINESAWGRSRFAKQGNNYFGQWCSAPGCGLIPKKRKPGSPWQVQKFNNAYGSIVSYMNNINSNRAYRELRNIRFELREAGKPLNPDIIAKGLGTYSQRGDQYITIMKNIMDGFQLAQVVRDYSGKA